MSGDWVTFEGRVEPLTWGRSTYTILRLPPGCGGPAPPRRSEER